MLDITASLVLNETGNVRLVYAGTVDSTGTLRAYSSDDLYTSFTYIDLGISGRAPDLLMQPSGRILLATHAAAPSATVTFRISDDDAATFVGLGTLAAGYYPKLWQDANDASCPLLCFSMGSETGFGTIRLYRSWDGGATWDDAINIVTGQPPQQPSVCGTSQRLYVAYHDPSGYLKLKVSDDLGGTYVDISCVDMNNIPIMGYYPKLWRDPRYPACPLLCFAQVDESGGAGTKLFTSLDGGTTWSWSLWEAGSGTPWTQLVIGGTGQWLFVDDQRYFSTYPILFFSHDYGTTWV